MDRGFDAGDFLAEVAGTGARYLVRLNANRRPPVLSHLPDGSFTSLTGGVKGQGHRRPRHRQLPRRHPLRRRVPAHDHPAGPLRHTLLQGRILRSGDPAGLEQEAWALLALYQALRIAVTDAVQSVPGTDPDRASYQVAVTTAQDLAATARNITDPDSDLTGSIGRAVLPRLHGPRRPRVCAHRVKSPLSRWNKHPPGRPRDTKKITAISTEIRHRPQSGTTRREPSVTNSASP